MADAPSISVTPTVHMTDVVPGSAVPGDFWYHTVTGLLFIYFDDGNTVQWVVTGGNTAGGGGSPIVIGSPVIMSETPPGTPTSGQLWWDTSLATLFIWYDDGDSKQWVPATPVPTETTGDLGLVHVGPVPPSPAVENTQWWNTDLGQMFVRYNDGTTVQWVPSSPSVAGYPSSGPINPEFFGATGNGATDDTSAFVALESSAPGSDVDLMDKVYVVTAIPRQANYFNGTWKIGSNLYPALPKKHDGPVDGQALDITRVNGNLFNCGTAWDQSRQFLWRFDAFGPAHEYAQDDPMPWRSMLIASFSRDHGVSWEGMRTIFADPTATCVRAGAIGNMSNGRVGGIIVTNEDATGTVRKSWFIYTDNISTTVVDGPSWTTVDLGIANQFPWGPIMSGPSGAAGDFIVSSYASSILCFRTLDNGATWALSTLKTSTGFSSNAQEGSLIYVPDKGWMMTIRPQTVNGAANKAPFLRIGFEYIISSTGSPATDWTLWGAPNNNIGTRFVCTTIGGNTPDPVNDTPGTAVGTYVYAATSPDFVTWSDWINTGVVIGNSLQWLIYDGGKAHLQLIHRSGNIQGTTYANSLVSYRVEAKAVFDDPSLLGKKAPKVMHLLGTQAIGCAALWTRMPRDANDTCAPWVHFLTAFQGRGTSAEPTESDIIMISQLPVTVPSIDAAREVVQLVDNPDMTQWPARIRSGVAVEDGIFASLTADQGLAGRWHYTPSGGTTTIQKVTLTEQQRKSIPFHPKFGMRLTSVVSNDFVGIQQRFYDEDLLWMKQHLNRGGQMVCRIWGMDGAMPSNYRIAAILNNSVAWGAANFPRPAVSNTSRLWVSEVTVDLGKLGVDWSSVTTLQFSLDNGSPASAFDFTLLGVFIYPMGCVANMEYAGQRNSLERASLYAMSLDAVSTGSYRADVAGVVTATNAARLVLNHEMRLTPTVLMSSQSNWKVAGATLDHDATYTFAATTKQVVLTAALTANNGVVGHPAMLKASAANKLILDTTW